MIIISLLLSTLTCYIYVELMCIIAEAISWICIFLVQISLIAASFISWYVRYWLVDQISFMKENEYPNSIINLLEAGYIVCYVFTILFAIFAIVYAVSLCSNFKNLKFAIEVIDASVHFLESSRKIFLSTMLFNALTVSVIFTWIICSCAIYSQGEIKPDTLFPQSRTVDLQTHNWWKLIILFLAMIWLKEFLKVMNMFIIMHATATYYNW